MTPAEILADDLAQAAQQMRARDEAFAFATIVRTVGSTAAKPGAKALLGADGTILHGLLGGGCTRGAVKRAVVKALCDGRPQLVSVAPEELLAAKGVAAGDNVDGMQFAKNGCPSRGTVDIFIEPCLPPPRLVVMGASPVAKAIAMLAPPFLYACRHSSRCLAVRYLSSCLFATLKRNEWERSSCPSSNLSKYLISPSKSLTLLSCV